MRLLLAAVGVVLLACGGAKPGPSAAQAALQVDQARFLDQATFGATEADLEALAGRGVPSWLEQQFAQPVADLAVPYLQARQLERAADPRGGFDLTPDQFFEYFFRTAVQAPDALRRRVAFALSQIFVVSMRHDTLRVNPLAPAAYYDLLTTDAFGNFRQLLEDVARHPAMGIYLSSIQNLPEDPRSGRQPDENFAREVMQLMTIGLDLLNPDGTPMLDGNGAPRPTYGHEDVAGLAKVFTGLGWYAPQPTDATFWTGIGVDSWTRLMSLYPQFHSTSAKTFLGRTLPAASAPDPEGDLKAALDILFNHPNVGPFIGRRLIQHLVTSNPSPAYVARVAGAFADNGQGVRGDLRAVIRAVLLDPEARDPRLGLQPGFGKLREPVLRVTHWMRAFGASSRSGRWMLGNTDAAATALGQSPLNAPSVFNFWRPGYAPDLPAFAGTGLVGPEFQGLDEVSVAGYLNFMTALIDQGLGGSSATSPATQGPDITGSYAREAALAGDPLVLVAHLDRLLTCGRMSPALKAHLLQALEAPAGAAPPGPPDAAGLEARAKLAIFLIMASPEYLHQH